MTTTTRTRVITYSQKRRGFLTRHTAWIQFSDGTHDVDSDHDRAALERRVEAKYGPQHGNDCGCAECVKLREYKPSGHEHGIPY